MCRTSRRASALAPLWPVKDEAPGLLRGHLNVASGKSHAGPCGRLAPPSRAGAVATRDIRNAQVLPASPCALWGGRAPAHASLSLRGTSSGCMRGAVEVSVAVGVPGISIEGHKGVDAWPHPLTGGSRGQGSWWEVWRYALHERRIRPAAAGRATSGTPRPLVCPSSRGRADCRGETRVVLMIPQTPDTLVRGLACDLLLTPGKPRDAPRAGVGGGRGTGRGPRQRGPARYHDRQPRSLARAPPARLQAARGRCSAGPLQLRCGGGGRPRLRRPRPPGDLRRTGWEGKSHGERLARRPGGRVCLGDAAWSSGHCRSPARPWQGRRGRAWPWPSGPPRWIASVR